VEGQCRRLGFPAEDGVEVVATGKLTTYPGRSNYQIVIDKMEIAGEGALLALLEKTKARLEAEGLFDPARKRRLPFLPGVIGVVTSPTGAVIRIFSTVWPTVFLPRDSLAGAGAGQGAAEQVANAVRGFSEMAPDGPIPRPDVLIVGRGGGSIEDLWSFNEEIVVRAIAQCSIPVISAVGHETDTTLADFAADMRAPPHRRRRNGRAGARGIARLCRRPWPAFAPRGGAPGGAGPRRLEAARPAFAHARRTDRGQGAGAG
jgi:exodeoxyribonuclease VII large subunit